MHRVILLVAVFVLVLVPLAPGVLGQGWDDDEEEEGMSDEEFKEFIHSLIQEIIDQAIAEGPLVDSESNSGVADYILRKIELQKVTVYFQETPFEECLNFLRDITGLNIVISPRARDIIEADDVNVNLRLRDIKLKSVLALMLEVSDELTYGVKYDVLYIGTREDWAKSSQYMIVYSISDIIYRPPDFPAPRIGLSDIIPHQ